jgi:lincosamide nucleotidyltransferase A/C/D/E
MKSASRPHAINPNMEAVDVLDLHNALQGIGVEIWIDGGWGVDALLEKQTRPHQDLDIAIQQKDVTKLVELLDAHGFQEIKLEIRRPHNFVLADNNGHEIDVHVIVLDEHGNGIYGPAENGEMYPAGALAGIGIIAGQTVRCISPEWTIKFHSGYDLKEKDFKDVSALCEKFAIELPTQYERFRP